MNIAVLLSGGVDSSVALRLLQGQGHSITAFYLKIWLEDELSYLGQCPWQEDLAYVQAVCKQAQVPLEVISLQRPYWDEVVTYTIDQIKKGFTPNPDMLCNQRIKFGAFDRMAGHRFDAIATGHYAQKVLKDGLWYLACSPDPIKDQTYFLAHLHQDQVARALFPIGHLTKAQVRQLAQDYELPTRDRKDSQGICFLGKLKFHDFIKHHLGEQEGSLIDVDTGAVIGKHQGFWFYTVGQRQGMGLPGGPWYVVKKDTGKNYVFVSRSYHAPDKIRDTVVVCQCNWIGHKPTQEQLGVKLRHGPSLYQAQIAYLDTRYLDTGALRVQLPQNDQGIAAGQFAVFYDGQLCLGCGVIAHE